MKQRIEATAQAINMSLQIYIVEQLNVCGGYSGSRGGQKCNENLQSFVGINFSGGSNWQIVVAMLNNFISTS